MTTTLTTMLRTAALALALLLGLAAVDVGAQTATEATDDAVDVQTGTVEEAADEDEGFDDWGLLGLLGLGGLAGLLRRPQPPVVMDIPVTRTTVERTVDTDVTRR